eukprot:12922758-Prorocentrum_lima.AAC.1
MIPHRDGNNVGPSWTISMGNLTGGQLWTERKDDTISPPFEAKGMDPSVKGKHLLPKEDGTSLMEPSGME